jgi:hypothetical protein
MEEPIIYIGKTGLTEDSESPFGIYPTDARFHTLLLGKTGAGKSTLLRNTILQLIAHGYGVGLIDPHGDLAEELLDHIPPSRADDLVYFDPADLDFPIGLNPIAGAALDDHSLIVSGIVGAFQSLWPDSWGPRMEYILSNAVAALLHCPNTSLLGVNRLLTDPEYRRWVVNQIDDPFIREFWENEYEGYDARFRREAIAPIQNKLGQFLLNPVIRNILGQVKGKVSIPFVMDNERIFIANLAKGKIGHDKANLLGSLLVTQFQLAAMRRAHLPEENRRDFFLFIDEFHNFTTEAFTSILAEARKYRLCLVLSHQYIYQLSPEVRKAVFGNVGTIITFRVGYEDAEALREEFARTYIAEQFLDLKRYEVFVRPHRDGEEQPPIRARTLPPIDYGVGRREKLVARSRERFATPRKRVQEKLKRWMAG